MQKCGSDFTPSIIAVLNRSDGRVVCTALPTPRGYRIPCGREVVSSSRSFSSSLSSRNFSADFFESRCTYYCNRVRVVSTS